MKKEKKWEKPWGSMSLIYILPEFLGWLKSGMFINYSKTCRMNDQMANLGCLLVCMFGNLLAPVLLAAHTVNNLNLGKEYKGYKSD